MRGPAPTALVVGAPRAAEAMARVLAAEGAAVTLGLAVVGAVPGLTCLPMDLTDPDSWFPPVLAAGGFDILVIVAESGADASLLERGCDLARLMETALAVPLDLIRLCVPRWRAQGWGRIVALLPPPDAPGASPVAAAALAALVRTLPRDLPVGTKINAAFAGDLAGALRLALLPEDGPSGTVLPAAI
ncbi:hypothetical protein [Frigidibacter mobilis]|uniref:Uncharacterized protein n=1 Tax=Frigidibacter mobilis TaxID=1335048 RepID=A0A159Z4G7_9RHOB|nr:hypothetical protein [Frigidibacter mobilis]AMY70065.1 hypothetical protein AKL17_2827 [Frigidibacter mobilis]